MEGNPRSGEEAVYAGFGLEQTQRSARGVDLTMPLFAIKLSQEPFFVPILLTFVLLSANVAKSVSDQESQTEKLAKETQRLALNFNILPRLFLGHVNRK